jgi:hypothetical protein
MSKKGVVEIQFNWIFALIAGALILALVVGFSSRWAATSAQKDAIKTLGNVETIITATGVVEGQSTLLPMPNVEFTYDCKELRISGASASGLSATNLFSPETLKGNGLLMWTTSWYVPFFAGNFVYLTTPQVKYNIIYSDAPSSSDLKDLLADIIPDRVNAEFSTTFTLKDENAPFYVFVFLGVPKSAPPAFGGRNVAAIEVTISPDNISGGVSFFKKEGDAWTPAGSSTWVKPELLLGAIVSGNGDIYECLRGNALLRVEILSALLLKKIELIEVADPDKYESAKNILNSMHTSAILKQLRGRDIRDLDWQNTILSYEAVPQVY